MKKQYFRFFLVEIMIIFLPFFSYASSENSTLDNMPSINARHAVVFDRNSKHIIYGKKEYEVCKMASTTKIMTAIIVLENSDLQDTVFVSSNAARIGGSRLGLKLNDKITVENLLYGLMMKSGNDAAIALAEHVGGSVDSFASMMNKKAENLNLSSTHFVTPHGLDDDNHYTTAYDLACLSDYALKNETFLKIVRTKTYTIYYSGHSKTISNTNELLGNLDGIYGIKTGFTNGANRCLVTACKRGDLDIICVVLGCDTKNNRTDDSINLINYTFNNFSLVNIKDIITQDFEEWFAINKNSFTINKGLSQFLDLYLDPNDFTFSHAAVNNLDLEKIETDISFDSYLDAPLQNNSKIGTIVLKINNTNFLTVKILNSNSISKKNFFYYIFYIFEHYYSFFINK